MRDFRQVLDTCYGCVNHSLTYQNESDMQDDWILDVLADLGEFAQANRLDALARELARAREVAVIELSLETVAMAGGGDRGAGSAGARSGNYPERPGP
jgi:hypothetical protein